MALTRYEPWSLLNQLNREMNHLFHPSEGNGEGSTLATADWTPTVDIKEEEDAYVLYADLPGVEPKDIDLQMDKGVLTLKGERKSETHEEREGYKRVERVRGSFFRRFSLPDTADSESISAKSVNGVLEVRIPKQAKAQPRRIAVDG